MFGFVKKAKSLRFTHTSRYSRVILNVLPVILKLILFSLTQLLFLLLAQALVPVYDIMPAKIVIIKIVRPIRFQQEIAVSPLVALARLIVVALLVPVLLLAVDGRAVVGQVVAGDFFLLLQLGYLLKKKNGNRYNFTESICQAGI